MKKKKSYLLLLPILLLASCGGTSDSEAPLESETSLPVESSSSSTSDPSSEDNSELLNARKAVNSLRGVDHVATMDQMVYVNQRDSGSYTTKDTYVEYFNEYQYSYGEESGDLEAYRRKNELHYGTLVEGTHDIVTDTDGTPLISVTSYPEELYFRDPETGVTILESLTMSNEVDKSIMADYDSNTGTFYPIVFEEEFINPFDFILPRDLTQLSDMGSKHQFSLSLDKAEFLADCYAANATNKIENCTITTDSEYQIERIDFVTPMEGGYDLGYSYERVSELTIVYSNRGAQSHIAHLTPYTVEHPELQAAFDLITNSESYRYEKRYLYGDFGSTEDPEDNIEDKIAGYMTKDLCFFHHHDDPDDTTPYEIGDDYDYVAKKEGDLYYGYEYNYSGYGWGWGKIVVSSSAYYTMDTYQDIGPSVAYLSPSIFQLKEGTDNVYVVDSNFDYRIGSFFDFQFLGVNSQVMETNTSEFELILEDDGSFTVHTGYVYYDNGRKVEQKIEYVFDASTVNNTTVPSYVTL